MFCIFIIHNAVKKKNQSSHTTTYHDRILKTGRKSGSMYFIHTHTNTDINNIGLLNVCEHI